LLSKQLALSFIRQLVFEGFEEYFTYEIHRKLSPCFPSMIYHLPRCHLSLG
jgi:hypothetical protein